MRLEEYLMNKKWSHSYFMRDTENVTGFKYYLYPKTFDYYMMNLNLEGSFIMYRHCQMYTGKHEWDVSQQGL